jgi:hypothetical protein
LCACARDARPAADYEPCDCRTTTSNVPRRQTAIDSLPTYHFTCPVTFPSDKDLPLHHVPAGCDPPETDARSPSSTSCMNSSALRTSLQKRGAAMHVRVPRVRQHEQQKHWQASADPHGALAYHEVQNATADVRRCLGQATARSNTYHEHC